MNAGGGGGARTQCPNCGQTVFNTHNSWKAHIEFCAITQLHQAVIEAAVTGSSQGVLSADIRRRVDRAVAAIQEQARAEAIREYRADLGKQPDDLTRAGT